MISLRVLNPRLRWFDFDGTKYIQKQFNLQVCEPFTRESVLVGPHGHSLHYLSRNHLIDFAMENTVWRIKTSKLYLTIQQCKEPRLICSLVFHSECNSIMNDSERNWGGLCKFGCSVQPNLLTFCMGKKESNKFEFSFDVSFIVSFQYMVFFILFPQCLDTNINYLSQNFLLLLLFYFLFPQWKSGLYVTDKVVISQQTIL